MLYLTRKIGESVVINDDIEVTVVDIRGKSIKLGFTFPPEASVLRREIYERIQEENRAAAEGGDALAEAFGSGRAAPEQSEAEAAPPESAPPEPAPPEPAPPESARDDRARGSNHRK